MGLRITGKVRQEFKIRTCAATHQWVRWGFDTPGALQTAQYRYAYSTPATTPVVSALKKLLRGIILKNFWIQVAVSFLKWVLPYVTASEAKRL
jgi:hypothetical protein